MASHLTFGSHERSTDIADLLIPQLVLHVTIYFYIGRVLA